MNSYERVMACFFGEKPDRVPVLPIVGQWCSKQAGIKFSDEMDSVEKHVYSQYYCVKKFAYDIVYDLSGVHAESEAMGCVIKYSEKQSPSVIKCPVENYKEDLPKLRILNPYKDGRLNMILEGITRLKELCNGEIPVGGYVQAPLRHAAMLRSPEKLLRDIYKDKENARELLEIATDSLIVWAVAVAQAGADIMFCSDPTSSGDLISPKVYQEWGLPYQQRLVSVLKKTGVKMVLHICGDTSDRLQMLVSTGVDCLSLDGKVDLGFAREKLGDKYLLMGNVDPTNPLALGTPEQVHEQSLKVIEKAGKGGHFFLSGGCVISDIVPPENMEAMIKAGHQTVY